MQYTINARNAVVSKSHQLAPGKLIDFKFQLRMTANVMRL